MLGKELGKYSTIIVSGGARGIDTHGHEGLLASLGYGIVVMGCGLDIVYPRENTKLFDRIYKTMVCLYLSTHLVRHHLLNISPLEIVSLVALVEV